MTNSTGKCCCHGTSGCFCSGLSAEESRLLNTRLPHNLDFIDKAEAWDRYQDVIGQLLIRMGSESAKLDYVARVILVRNLGGVRARLSLLPTLGRSARYLVERHGLNELLYRFAGELCLMELSAAAGYRTFCFPDLVRGLVKSGKMRDRSFTRMIDTFEFLKSMFLYPYNDERVLEQLERTNGLHSKYRVAGTRSQEARDLFKYIALNMFYIGPSMRPDLTPRERYAICGITTLVAERMGHTIDGTVLELERFIRDYEAAHMFERTDPGNLRRHAIDIAAASRLALEDIPTISPARIHGYVPYRVKKILEID